MEDANTYRWMNGNVKCLKVTGGSLLAGGKKKVFYAVRRRLVCIRRHQRLDSRFQEPCSYEPFGIWNQESGIWHLAAPLRGVIILKATFELACPRVVRTRSL